jgi:IMP dehydrogenase
MKIEDIQTALTFDDVLLVPRRSSVLPRDVELKTQLTRNIRLNLPFLSAAMDRVTESRTAIALAQLGGMGVIHKNMSVEKQASEVDRVKRSESGMIVDPITLSPNARIFDALELMKKYHISGVPITDDGTNEGHLVGILTNRDLRFESNLLRPVRELMTSENLITVPVGTDMATAKEKFHRHKVEKLLVVDDERRLQGLITVKDLDKKLNFPHASKDDLGRLRVGAAIGVGSDVMERAEALVAKHVDVLFLESAHAHSDTVMRLAEQIRKQFAQTDLIVGNVATAEAVKDLISIGVDAVKVGIGAGSICTTRIIAGIGVPMISAIMNCVEAATDNVPIIADGGIRFSGDITKAIAAGAKVVMMGNLFAATDEAPGEMILYQGRSFKEYRGMGSIAAMREGSSDRYFQDEFDLDSQVGKLVPEGIEGRVPHRGGLSAITFQLAGGLRAGMGYCGAASIPELQWNARFIRITPAGMKESHVHDVVITQEAPNYRQS